MFASNNQDKASNLLLEGEMITLMSNWSYNVELVVGIVTFYKNINLEIYFDIYLKII